MKITGIGESKNISDFVASKIAALNESEVSFRLLFDLMFREKENILYEKSEGYHIIETSYGEAYQNILKLSARIGTELSEVPKGAVLGLYMENSLLWIETFWAILAAGYRPLLMNLRLDHNTLAKALSDLNAAAVFSLDEQFEVRTINPANMQQERNANTELVFGDEIYVMSSGTSERVKLCGYGALEFYHLLLNSAKIVENCKMIRNHYEGRLKQLCFLPFYHIFGLVAVYLWFGFFSRTFVELRDYSPQTILNTIRRHKVTHIFAVPLFWEKVYDAAIKTIQKRGERTVKKFSRGLAISGKIGDLPFFGKAFKKIAFHEVRENLFGESVQFMITGGSAIRSEVMSFFNGIGYFLTDGYGASEIGITSVELSRKAKIRNACFVGKPMDGIEYKISEHGELLVSGKAIARTIFENGEKKPLCDYYETRDLAECINGHYRILGRIDDLLIAADGENLNPNLIEPQLMTPQMKGCCLLGVDKDSETVPILLVSVDRYLSVERFTALDKAVRAKIQTLPMGSSIKKIVYTSDPLLHDNEIKLNRRRLSRDYAHGNLNLIDFSKGRDDTRFDVLSDKICEFFSLALSREKNEIVGTFDFFLDGGGSSLDYFAMITAMQEEFSLDFPVNAGKSLQTPDEFYEYIKAAKK